MAPVPPAARCSAAREPSFTSGMGGMTYAHAEVGVLKAANPLTNLQHVTPYFLNSLSDTVEDKSQGR